MVDRGPFSIRYDALAVDHLLAIERKYHSLIRRTIEEQLTDQPERETRNRKPLIKSAAFGGAWEIRFGPGNRFRVFYDVDNEDREVIVVAIGVKQGNRLLLGGEEVQL